MKYKKLIFSVIFFTVLLMTQNVFAGCFPRKDAYVELISKEPNIKCIFVGTGSSCTGILEIHIRNYCEDTLVYKDRELHNYNKNITKNIPVSLNLTNFSQEIGDKWSETLYYKNNPNKKITLSFEIKEKNKSLNNINKKNKNGLKIKDGVQIVGLNLFGYVFVILIFSVIFIFLFKKWRK